MAGRFGLVKLGPPIEVFALNKAYTEDDNPNKVNLGVGAYRTDEGRPWVLPVVKKVEQDLAVDPLQNHEYLPVLGLEAFSQAATAMLLGENNPALLEGRAFGVQTLSGTGALRVAAEFLARILKLRTFYYSKPTWENHHLVFINAGFTNPQSYRYWNPDTKSIDFEGMCDDLRNAPENSVIILHACAHNPTGCDPTKEQWQQLSEIIRHSPLHPCLENFLKTSSVGLPHLSSLISLTCVATINHMLKGVINRFSEKARQKKASNHVTPFPKQRSKSCTFLESDHRKAVKKFKHASTVLRGQTDCVQPLKLISLIDVIEWVSPSGQERNLFPFFDSAYQGFASGDLEEDAWAVRYFARNGFELLASQSFAKNFGLYNERVGNLTFVVGDKSAIPGVRSQVTLIIRGMYSNPPNHGARIVATVLNNPQLFEEWKECIRIMSSRIKEMREGLKKRLQLLGTPNVNAWNHITDQIGMFSYSGLTPKQVERMVQTHHIYMLKSGRMNMCGLNTKNLDYVAEAIHDSVLACSDDA